MSIMSLDVVSGNNSWSIPLERRITILKGDSGSGKTELVNAIQNRNQLTSVSCDLPCVVVNDTTWELVMSNSKDSLIIFDDLEIVSSMKFAGLLSSTESNKNYFLLITREEFDTNDFKYLSIAVSSILKLVYDINNPYKHYTEKYYLFEQSKSSIKDIDVVLTEDSKNGYDFFSKLFSSKRVEHAKDGKSSITKDTCSIKYGNVLVLVDMAAFGCHIEEFVTMTDASRTFVISSYECFEEFLLRTNFFKDNLRVINVFNDIHANANKCISWETYFEELLKEVSNGTVIRVPSKSSISFCWLHECSECKRPDSESCKYRMDEKLKGLLLGTKYESLLDMGL